MSVQLDLGSYYVTKVLEDGEHPNAVLTKACPWFGCDVRVSSVELNALKIMVQKMNHRAT